MSLRQTAKILGVHHSTLSKCINGQRGWNPELKARYEQLATSLNESGGTADGGDIAEVGKFVPVRNGEPGGTRTHDTRIKSPMLYQTELPAHNDIIKAFHRYKSYLDYRLEPCNFITKSCTSYVVISACSSYEKRLSGNYCIT